ncbi:MAG: tetratricopeptide repeat protein, partial [Blastocatellia bacterium]
ARALGLKPDDVTDNGKLQQMTPRHRLVILDEAENVYQRDGFAFLQLLDALISAPAKPYVIVTSQTDPNTAKAPALNVRRLSKEAAFRLFASNANLTPEQFARVDLDDLYEALGYVDRLPRAVELIARVWRRDRGANQQSVDLKPLLLRLREDHDRVMRHPDYPDAVKSVTVGVQYAYDRLNERNQAAARLWSQLALFPGGVSKAGLSRIFGDGATELAGEIERQSLVEFPYAFFPPPFNDLMELPTPFRFFALRQLPAGGEAAARQAIGESALRYYFDFDDEPHRGWAGALDQTIRQSGELMGAFILRFNAELPSIESWLDWAYDHEMGKANRARSPRLTAALRNIYEMTDALRRQRNRLDRALACASRCADSAGEANVRKALGDLLMREDDLRGAREQYEAALAIYPAIGDRLGEANAMASMARLALAEGDETEADRLQEKATAINQAIGARFNTALGS